jgi:hypothetical protein
VAAVGICQLAKIRDEQSGHRHGLRSTGGGKLNPDRSVGQSKVIEFVGLTAFSNIF